jgi:hypothetical protein
MVAGPCPRAGPVARVQEGVQVGDERQPGDRSEGGLHREAARGPQEHVPVGGSENRTAGWIGKEHLPIQKCSQLVESCADRPGGGHPPGQAPQHMRARPMQGHEQETGKNPEQDLGCEDDLRKYH